MITFGILLIFGLTCMVFLITYIQVKISIKYINYAHISPSMYVLTLAIWTVLMLLFITIITNTFYGMVGL